MVSVTVIQQLLNEAEQDVKNNADLEDVIGRVG